MTILFIYHLVVLLSNTLRLSGFLICLVFVLADLMRIILKVHRVDQIRSLRFHQQQWSVPIMHTHVSGINHMCPLFWFNSVLSLKKKFPGGEIWILFKPATLLCLTYAQDLDLSAKGRGLLGSVSSVKTRWEVIVRFVDAGGIDDHHCLNFLFIVIKVHPIQLLLEGRFNNLQ